MEEACLLLVKVALGWHRDAEGEHLFRREAGVDLKGVVEALDKQAGADQKDQPHCRLCDDQDALQAVVASADESAAARFAESAGRVLPGSAPGRQYAEK